MRNFLLLEPLSPLILVKKMKIGLLVVLRKMTHDVTYGDGSRGLRTLTRSQALVKESYFNEEFLLASSGGVIGLYYVREPSNLTKQQSIDTDSESEDQKTINYCFFHI